MDIIRGIFGGSVVPAGFKGMAADVEEAGIGCGDVLQMASHAGFFDGEGMAGGAHGATELVTILTGEDVGLRAVVGTEAARDAAHGVDVALGFAAAHMAIHAEFAGSAAGDHVTGGEGDICDGADLVFIAAVMGVMAGGADDGFPFGADGVFAVDAVDEADAAMAWGAGCAAFAGGVAGGDGVAGGIPFLVFVMVGSGVMALGAIAGAGADGDTVEATEVFRAGAVAGFALYIGFGLEFGGHGVPVTGLEGFGEGPADEGLDIVEAVVHGEGGGIVAGGVTGQATFTEVAGAVIEVIAGGD
ncbi:MAG: hypothetical protein RI897_1882 [Verrucomicrobiota bacterium]